MFNHICESNGYNNANSTKFENYKIFQYILAYNIKLVHKLFCACEYFLFLFKLMKILHHSIFVQIDSTAARNFNEKTMDITHYHNFDLLKIWKNVFHTFFGYSVGMKTSCVIYKIGEHPHEMKKTITVNKFIPMLYLMLGKIISGFIPTLVERINENRRIVVNMSPKAAEVWNGIVGTEWKEKFPSCTEWIDGFPKG